MTTDSGRSTVPQIVIACDVAPEAVPVPESGLIGGGRPRRSVPLMRTHIARPPVVAILWTGSENPACRVGPCDVGVCFTRTCDVVATAVVARRTAHVSDGGKAVIDETFVKQVEAAQSVDRAIGTVEETLRRAGDWTTPYSRSDPTTAITWASTDCGRQTHRIRHRRARPARRRRSRAAGRGRRRPRRAEHRPHPDVRDPRRRTGAADPDQQSFASGNPLTCNSLRGPDRTHTHDSDGEYHDRRTDPEENHNLARTPGASRIAALDRQLVATQDCHAGAQCRAAGVPGRS